MKSKSFQMRIKKETSKSVKADQNIHLAHKQKRYLAIASLKLRRVRIGEQLGVRLRAMVREGGDRGPRRGRWD